MIRDAALDRERQPPRPRPISSPPAPRQPVSFRAFGFVSEQAFTASTTFDAVFESSVGTFFGGGAQVLIPHGLFGELAVSRFRKTGQRAFRDGAQAFRLGIP